MKKLLTTVAMLTAMTGAAAANGVFIADSFSQPSGAVGVGISNPVNANVSAGQIDLHNNASNTDLLVWCLDLHDLLFVPYTFTETNYVAGLGLPGLPGGGLDGSQLRQIASLMNRGMTLGGTNSSFDDAATQLAIWRVEYGPSFTDNAVGGLAAQALLEFNDSVAGGLLDCPLCTLTILSDAVNAPNQALGFATPFAAQTPLPASAWLFGAGLVGLAGMVRKRRSNRLA